MPNFDTFQDLFENLSTSESESEEYDIDLSFAQCAATVDSATHTCDDKKASSVEDKEIIKLVEYFSKSQMTVNYCKSSTITLQTKSKVVSLPPPEKYARKNKQHMQ